MTDNEKKEKVVAALHSLLTGNEESELLKAINTTPPVSIRLHPIKTFPLAELNRVPWCPLGRYLPERPVFTLDPLFHAGAYYPQEASSMFIWNIIQQHLPDHPVRILDLCAAPGGKSTLVASLLRENDILIANEIDRSRCSVLRETIQKFGHPQVYVTNNAPADFSALESCFDIILIDAPCSGEGMFRKDPVAVEEWSEQNVVLCTQRQHDILEKVWPALKENGILIYSTCTYNTKENEDQILAFCSENECSPVEVDLPVTYNIQTGKAGEMNTWRFFPHRIQGEGFFVSALRKEEKSGHFHQRKKDIPTPKREKENLSFVLPEWQSLLYTDNEHIWLQKDPALIAHLKKHLRFALEYHLVATRKGKDLIPAPEFALSIAINKNAFEQVELEKDEALRFLKTEDIRSSGAPGWNLVTFQNIPLGWIKQLPNRSNNYFPKEWKIRIDISK